MRITWSVPVRGERVYSSSRGDLVRARSLIEALRTEGHDVRVVEDAARAGARLRVSAYRNVVRRILPSRLALVLRDVGRWMHARPHAHRVAAEARKQDAEVIIETQVNFAGSGALAAQMTGLPLILDDCSPSSEEVDLGAGFPGLARRILRRQAEAASVVVAVSRAVRGRLIEEGVPGDKICIVPNGVDLAAYGGIDREAVRQRLGLAERCVLGFVGSFQPWHTVELLVKALGRLTNDHLVHLLLVGDGPELESALATAHRLSVSHRVTAFGPVPSSRVAELLVACDVGVLPGSNDYGHPMKLMEYAAAGLPSVAPDLGVVREVIQDGMTGLLFPPGDLDRLTTALTRLAADANLRRRLGECARNRVAVGASWTDRARALLAHAIGQPAGIGSHVQDVIVPERSR